MFSFLNPYLWIAALAVLASTAAGSFYGGYKAGTTLVQTKWDASVTANRAGQDAALRAAAAAIAKIEVKSERVIQPMRTEIRTNTIYRDCLHSPDSLRLLNSLITGTEAEAQPAGGGGVSAPDSAR